MTSVMLPDAVAKRFWPVLSSLDHVLDGPHIAQIDRIPILDLRAGDVQPAISASVAHGPFLESQTARRVTRPAVSKALHKIGAAVPERVLLRIGYERRRVEEEGIPVRQPEAQAEREAHLGSAVRFIHGGEPLAEIGPECAHILFVDLGEGGIGHGRVEAMAVPRHALAHGPVEGAERPAADPCLRIRRDVGRPYRPERRREREAAGHGRSALRGVTGDAVTHLGEVSATLDQRLIDRDPRRRLCPARCAVAQRSMPQRHPRSRRQSPRQRQFASRGAYFANSDDVPRDVSTRQPCAN